MTRTCAPDENTRITHTVNVPECCPVSGNPRAGSTLSISYIPTTGLVFPVEDLEAMTREYVGGLGSIRAMEEMIQHIHGRVVAIVGAAVSIKADLRIAPPFGGAEQGMVIEVGADMLTTLAAENATLRDQRDRAIVLMEKAQDRMLATYNAMDALRASEAAAMDAVHELLSIIDRGRQDHLTIDDCIDVENARAITHTSDKEPKT